MKIEELAALYTGCTSFETQYMPTYRKILAFLGTDDVRDICTKYEEYKDKIPGITSDAKTKHIKSLKDKLVNKGVLHPVCITSTNQDEADEAETSDEEADEADEAVASGDRHSEEFARKIRHLAWKTKVLQSFYDMVIDHIHHLPQDVLAAIVKENITTRIQDVYEDDA
jgi:hypothetical protein